MLAARNPKPGGISFYLPLVNAFSTCRKLPVLLAGGGASLYIGSGNRVLLLWRFITYVIIVSEWCDFEMWVLELPFNGFLWTRYFDCWLCSYLHVVCCRNFYPCGAAVLRGAMTFSCLICLMFLGHTPRNITVGSTPLDEWSARHRDPYLTTHNT
jgi:hypothetical protein